MTMGVLKIISALFKDHHEEVFSDRFLKDPDWDFGYSRMTDKYYASIGGFGSNQKLVQFTSDKSLGYADCGWTSCKESRELYKLIKKGYEVNLPSQIKIEEDRRREKEKEQLNFINEL